MGFEPRLRVTAWFLAALKKGTPVRRSCGVGMRVEAEGAEESLRRMVFFRSLAVRSDQRSRGRYPRMPSLCPFADNLRSGLITAGAMGPKRAYCPCLFQTSTPIIHPNLEIRQSPILKKHHHPVPSTLYRLVVAAIARAEETHEVGAFGSHPGLTANRSPRTESQGASIDPLTPSPGTTYSV